VVCYGECFVCIWEEGTYSYFEVECSAKAIKGKVID
jgi:hypothetical protein